MTHEEAKERRAKISDLMRNGPDGKCLTKAQARAVVDGLPIPSNPKPRPAVS